MVVWHDVPSWTLLMRGLDVATLPVPKEFGQRYSLTVTLHCLLKT